MGEATGTALRQDAPDSEGAEREVRQLFRQAIRHRSSEDFRRCLHFMARFPGYSPFNTMLAYVQRRNARMLLPASRWQKEYGRRPKADAAPVVLLRPMGPLMLVYELGDTEPIPGKRNRCADMEEILKAYERSVACDIRLSEQQKTRMLDRLAYYMAVMHGIRLVERWEGAGFFASLERLADDCREDQEVQLPKKRGEQKHRIVRIPVRYHLSVNRQLDPAQRIAAIAHELGHLYCGHLGEPAALGIEGAKGIRWPAVCDRRSKSEEEKEFEAETVAWLVCRRKGLEVSSARYLASYLKDSGGPEAIPDIDMDVIARAVAHITKMLDTATSGRIRQAGRSRQRTDLPMF